MRIKRTFTTMATIGAILIFGNVAEAGLVHLVEDAPPDYSYDVRAEYFAGSGGGGYAGGYIEIDRVNGAGKLEVGAYAGAGDCVAEPIYCASLTTIIGELNHNVSLKASDDFYTLSGAPRDVDIPLHVSVYALVGGDGYSEARVSIANTPVVSATSANRYQSLELELLVPDGGGFDVGLYVFTTLGGGVSTVIADPVTVIDPSWTYAAFADLIDIEDTFPAPVASYFGDPTPSPVPVPAAVWLFGTGIIGLIGFSKRKSKVAA